MATTLERFISDRVKELPGDQAIAFLLEAIPFIQEHQAPVAQSASTNAHNATGVGSLISHTAVYREKSVLARFKWESKYCESTKEDFDVVWDDSQDSKYEAYVCKACGESLVVDAARAEMVCPACGQVLAYQEDLEPTPDDHTRTTMISSFSYKRNNHFMEHVSTLQGRENTSIPDEVIAKVRQEFEKARMTKPENITQPRVRQFLKKLGYSKLYEHSWCIVSMLGGQGVAQIPPELEAKLKQMFQQIQAPFERCKPPGRKNFLSYSYVLRKMCELLGEDTYLPHLPLLKSREKLIAADRIWKDICQELKWQYVPTL